MFYVSVTPPRGEESMLGRGCQAAQIFASGGCLGLPLKTEAAWLLPRGLSRSSYPWRQKASRGRRALLSLSQSRSSQPPGPRAGVCALFIRVPYTFRF